MSYIYSYSARGYSHKNNNKPCQDFSSSYKDKDRCIITCCDGHGGDAYIRSDRGSKFASTALLTEFMKITRKQLVNADEDFLNKVKLSILCTWNSLVESDYGYNQIKTSAIKKLDEDHQFQLKHYPTKAYGTTMAGALVMDDYMLVVSIGDTEVLGIKNGELVKLFDDTDEPVANITYSMCQEDAFDYIKAVVIKTSSVDGIILCTDGLSAPYQSYDNFLNAFIKPLFSNIIKRRDANNTTAFIDDIANELGTGDDVSLAYYVSSRIPKKYYET